MPTASGASSSSRIPKFINRKTQKQKQVNQCQAVDSHSVMNLDDAPELKRSERFEMIQNLSSTTINSEFKFRDSEKFPSSELECENKLFAEAIKKVGSRTQSQTVGGVDRVGVDHDEDNSFKHNYKSTNTILEGFLKAVMTSSEDLVTGSNDVEMGTNLIL